MKKLDTRLKGVNLGNWLVLEKWMDVQMFDGTTAEDEYYLPTQLPEEVYRERIRMHRAGWIGERDFAMIKSLGFNAVRIPVPYFVFGDRPPFIGCIEELDRAFRWAERYDLKVLIDLHTAPGSQNGYDNGGVLGVCRFFQEPEEIAFVCTVLERLARRYGKRKGLFGIGYLNEPASEVMWEQYVRKRCLPQDEKMAEGSRGYRPEELKAFYREAYERVSPYLAPGRYVVLQCGHEPQLWKDFMQGPQYGNVVLDIHRCLMGAEREGCGRSMEAYERWIRENFAGTIREMSEYFPVICGEWSLFNSLASGRDTHGGKTVLNGLSEEAEKVDDAGKRRIYRALDHAQKEAWEEGSGYFYWSWKLNLDTVSTADWEGMDAFDLQKSVANGWYRPE